jgi:hypothetical protein
VKHRNRTDDFWTSFWVLATLEVIVVGFWVWVIVYKLVPWVVRVLQANGVKGL